MNETKTDFEPYIAETEKVSEFTPRAILIGSLFGVLFGAASVYLALRAGLSVSASIPVAVLTISLGRKF
ncbi:MAG TPA: OPT/YSL family transporter, partial [Chroococcales cyanobacterium]